MSRQIQIRRGNATENDAFTGAVGELTMDTTNKTLRVHDGETTGGTVLAKQSALDTADYVIESQMPTAENNYTWYRKYKSGWVEQGGVQSGNVTINEGSEGSLSPITLPVPMANNKYVAMSQCINTYCLPFRVIMTPTTVNFMFGAYTVSRTLVDYSWYVVGQAL